MIVQRDGQLHVRHYGYSEHRVRPLRLPVLRSGYQGVHHIQHAAGPASGHREHAVRHQVPPVLPPDAVPGRELRGLHEAVLLTALQRADPGPHAARLGDDLSGPPRALHAPPRRGHTALHAAHGCDRQSDESVARLYIPLYLLPEIETEVVGMLGGVLKLVYNSYRFCGWHCGIDIFDKSIG